MSEPHCEGHEHFDYDCIDCSDALEKQRREKYPATCVVHWPSGPVNSCEKHARELVGLGKFMGAHVPVTSPTKMAACSNCVNEAKSENNNG